MSAILRRSWIRTFTPLGWGVWALAFAAAFGSAWFGVPECVHLLLR